MTQINKELLEKYDLGQCTEQERKLVRDWLDNDDWNELAIEDNSEAIPPEQGKAIWNNLETFIEKEEQQKPHISFKYIRHIAASILFLLGGYTLLTMLYKNPENSAAHYSSIEKVTRPFTLILGKNSQADIDMQSGSLTLSGEILFTPTEDLVLKHGKQANLFFKAGETYYVVESKETNQIIIVKKDDFTFLPVIVQKQIRKQFQIS